MSNKTAKKVAAAVALLLAAIMIFSVIASGLSYAAIAADSISGLKKQLSTIEQQKAAVKKEIAALDQKINVVSEKKAALDRQMELTQDEIDTTEAIIKQLADQIVVKEAELEVATRDLEKKTDLYVTRTRTMYENGTVSYLDVLLSSNDIADMLTRLEIISQIMEFDQQVVADYQAAKEDIETKKTSLETDKGDEERFKGTLEDKYSALDSQQEEQAKLLSDLNANLDAKRVESEKMETEQKSINSEIERLSREAAERARLEAQRKAQSQGKSVAPGGGAATPTSGSFTWPLPGYGKGSITSPYGYRNCPYHGRELHSGTDLGAPKGAPIVAAASGKVVKSYMSNSYGNYTTIDHGGGLMTSYAHQSKRLVSVGDQVSAGQKIGLVGSTGNSTGNHLHFEVYVNGSTTNPMQYFN